ncbi:hypothetical protein [Spirosoma sordidisoli]|uniref:Uncharacterized protein n=1 Tax=Spirosoma sordidisoli TaxID=2502893 RepID=A0A4Q2UJZ2_9BACT|nr:hypothetical protein [Spirosoma sordidisoli]RYC69833.1 hypothetical protein EQG79_14665 [Spirosoma sordidisoli]
MTTSAEQLILNLQEIIALRQVNLIRIYRVDSSLPAGSVALYQQSTTWAFGHKFIKLGQTIYPIQQVLAFYHTDKVLSLYIHSFVPRSNASVFAYKASTKE